MNLANDGYLFRESVDKFGERVHYLATRIWKGVRPFYYFENSSQSKLTEIDFSNSQPYFASKAVTLVPVLVPEFLPILPLLENLSNKEDFKKFDQLCTKGRIYDHWVTIRGYKPEQRNKAKSEFIKILYGKLDQKVDYAIKAYNAFEKEFPSVAEAFVKIKSLTERELPFIKEVYLDKDGSFIPKYHCNLSLLLQRCESRFIIKTVCDRLFKDGVQNFITIHDSFLTTEENVQVIKNIIASEFRKLSIEPPVLKDGMKDLFVKK
ncbi:MAG: hypothetical protein J7604_25915 [Sporocytophaga sp.]|uniref:hypothetical protein n=1 Tax=Sporocytophaga sp. TaxID=2231183 RepID=UPI001B15C493|nr:hypothetical protein [Sporocytophaga sp.]MBO9703668.1 hypothetical protein [Sporocytophaga sp.]